MIFVINRLKYDTDKMELISVNCEYSYSYGIFKDTFRYSGRNVKLWKSKKNNWLITYDSDFSSCGVAIDEANAKSMLLKYDIAKYEEIFGELEEA